MPYIREELRQTLILELSELTQKIQTLRFYNRTGIFDKQTVDEELKDIFKDLFEVTQALRELEGEEWVYPRLPQYRNHDPRSLPGDNRPDPLAYLQDVPPPPERYEIFEEDPGTGTRSRIRSKNFSPDP